jgi:signal transduction histidine kinase
MQQMTTISHELTGLERASRRGDGSGPGGPARHAPAAPAAPAWLRTLLGVPLAWKLVGKNVVVGVVTALAVIALHDAGAGALGLVAVVSAAVAISLGASFAIVRVALRPLDTLEATADRVWRGDFGARVPGSLLADPDLSRLGHTLNLLLDGIERDRGRMRRLAAQIVAAQDEERSRVARELHDSVAQTLAALVMQLGAAGRAADDPATARQFALVRDIAGDALEEVRLLSHTVYPRVLDDLGLQAALEWLARQTHEAEGLTVSVRAGDVPADLPAAHASALYRVAQESLRNAVRHAQAHEVRLELSREGRAISLTVTDDGRGFDVAEAEGRRPGMGLFAMRERVALVDGVLEIESAPGSGTRVRASVPLTVGQAA